MARMDNTSRRLQICVLLGGVLLIIAFLNSRALETALYKLPVGGSYDKYARLTKLLRLGMTPEEVRGVLGTPESVYSSTNGFRWLYDEVEATTGWEYVADFQGAQGSLKLVYLRNIEHVVFPTSRRFELGTPLQSSQFPLGH